MSQNYSYRAPPPEYYKKEPIIRFHHNQGNPFQNIYNQSNQNQSPYPPQYPANRNECFQYLRNSSHPYNYWFNHQHQYPDHDSNHRNQYRGYDHKYSQNPHDPPFNRYKTDRRTKVHDRLGRRTLLDDRGQSMWDCMYSYRGQSMWDCMYS